MTRLITSLTIIFLVGCGGGGGGGGSAGISIQPPIITSQPTSITIYENSTTTFSVSASGDGTLTYQWKKNGVNISGGNSTTYTTNSVSLSDNNSSFTVDVSNSGGTTTSAVATLNVLQLAPSITTAPTSQTIVSGQTAQFSVTAAGYPNLEYQWYKNGNAITGANDSSYSTPVTIGDSGSGYSVKVTNSISSVTSSSAVLTVQQSTLTDLVISEISTCYYVDINCWFEIYNPTSTTINLSSYNIRSYGIHTSNFSTTVTNFTLPSITIEPDAYILISGNYENKTQIGTQNIKIRNGAYIPYWADNGFVELIKAGNTVDFVIFGNLNQSPVTISKWTGANINAIPYSSSDYGKSIVRLYPRNSDTDTDSASDWNAVNWATPGGRNDIGVSVSDADGDGIPDSAEVSGGTFAGIDLYAMGARVGQKDIFVEVDRMDSNDPGITPIKGALQKVVDAFNSKGIKLRFDAGNSFNSSFSIDDFNLGQGSNTVTYEQCVTMDQGTCSLNTSTKRSIYDWKDEFMTLKRRSIFHYMLFGNSQNANGSCGSSGVAELPGNDLIISLGGCGLSLSNTTNINLTTNYQAATIMHELGHNLGLRHGGNENTNYKPNYWSVMNYMYQLNGLDPDASSQTAFERWRKEKGDGTPALCNLVASPCGSTSQFTIDFSSGTSSILIESSLIESNNIGRGTNSSAYADWNLNGSLTNGSVSRDLNADGSLTNLADFDDWSNLVFPFARHYYGNSGKSLITATPPLLNPIFNDRQPYADEYPILKPINAK